MKGNFETNKPTEEGTACNISSAVASVSHSARLENSSLGNVTPCAWPSDSLLQQPIQQRSNLPIGPADMSFPNRRGSLGSFAGDLSFPNSRRNSLAFGLEFNAGEQQQLSADMAALTSQSQSLASHQSLLNSGLGQSVNAQLLLASNPGREGLAAQHRQLLLQQQQLQQQQLQQHQQQQSLSMMERPSDARRVQAEAQAAAAALFFGAPLPGNDNSPTNGLGQLSQLGGSNEQISGSRNFLGNSLGNSAGLPSHLAAPSALPSATQDMHLNLNLRAASANSGLLASLDTSSLNPLNSFSQLQQLQQQQQQLQHLQSSLGALGGDHSSMLASSQQLQQQQQQQQQQQIQQQQLQRQQQQLHRHSLSLGFPFDVGSSTSIQQLEQKRGSLGLSLGDQLRHQDQLDKLQSRGGMSSTDGKRPGSASYQSPAKRTKAGSKDARAASANASSKGSANKKDASFPLKLHEILSNQEYEEMIAWMPHGKSWRILKPSAFENVVIPLHFRHSKYASFMRQVNGWGFERVLHGNDHNSYKHDLFVKDNPELCKKMKRMGTVKKAKEDPAAADSQLMYHAVDVLSSQLNSAQFQAALAARTEAARSRSSDNTNTDNVDL